MAVLPSRHISLFVANLRRRDAKCELAPIRRFSRNRLKFNREAGLREESFALLQRGRRAAGRLTRRRGVTQINAMWLLINMACFPNKRDLPPLFAVGGGIPLEVGSRIAGGWALALARLVGDDRAS